MYICINIYRQRESEREIYREYREWSMSNIVAVFPKMKVVYLYTYLSMYL